MSEKIKHFTINAVKILVLVFIWIFLFHSCNRPTQYEKGYEDGYEQGYEDANYGKP